MTCKFCGLPFEWSLRDGRYIPVHAGTPHFCQREVRERDRRLARRDDWKKAHAGELKVRAAVLGDAKELDKTFKEAVR
jgi:hypothetical protein